MKSELEKYIKLLTEYLEFKTISADSSYKEDILNNVSWLKNLLTNLEFKVEILETKDANPVVYGEVIHDSKLETILIYGHYDVQPAEDSGWYQDPFSLKNDGTKLYGRGVVDNKGHNLIYILTIADLLKKGKLKYNIKLLLEGDEETGSEHISDFLTKYKDKLASDYILISDGEIKGLSPCIEVSCRGLGNIGVELTTANTNVHSGIFGGAIPMASVELVHLLSKLFNLETNVINVPGFYEGSDVSPDELENNKQISFDDSYLESLIGAKILKTEKKLDYFTQTGLRPMITISGINSGYIGEGYASIIPALAYAKLNVRLAPNQNPDLILGRIKSFIENNAPSYVDLKVSIDEKVKGVKMNPNTKLALRAIPILESVYGEKVFRSNVGGSLPIISDFQRILGLDVLSIPFANEDCNMHGVNENFNLDLIEKAFDFSYKLLS